MPIPRAFECYYFTVNVVISGTMKSLYYSSNGIETLFYQKVQQLSSTWKNVITFKGN
jgi:hypothetical protein